MAVQAARSKNVDILRAPRTCRFRLLRFRNIETLETQMANINHALGIVTVAALATALPQQQIKADDAGAYHVAQVWQIGGKGGWDYVTVDSRNKLLYLPRTTHTLVVDANN